MSITLLNRFREPEIDIPEDWEITAYPNDVKHVYEDLLWEIKQYDGEVARDFVVLHDKTVYQILVLLKAMQSCSGKAEDEVITDMSALLENE